MNAPVKLVDCQRCGAVVVQARWDEHLRQHLSGELKTLPIAEAMEINRIAYELGPILMPEDFK